MATKNKTNDRVHILGVNTVEEEGTITEMYAPPPKGKKAPKGQVWHAVLGRFVPKADADKEMWVDKSETVLADDDSETTEQINTEVPMMSVEEGLLKAVEHMSTDAALALLAAYRKMPDRVKKATRSVYKALQRLGNGVSIEEVKATLTALKDACGEKYEKLYKRVLNESKRIVPKIQARLFKESLG